MPHFLNNSPLPVKRLPMGGLWTKVIRTTTTIRYKGFKDNPKQSKGLGKPRTEHIGIYIGTEISVRTTL